MGTARTNISPGLFALGPGKFSQNGAMATKLIGTFNSARPSTAEQTTAAPPMSPRISFMFWRSIDFSNDTLFDENPVLTALGFSEIPPLSKVMPFPTNTRG